MLPLHSQFLLDNVFHLRLVSLEFTQHIIIWLDIGLLSNCNYHKKAAFQATLFQVQNLLATGKNKQTTPDKLGTILEGFISQFVLAESSVGEMDMDLLYDLLLIVADQHPSLVSNNNNNNNKKGAAKVSENYVSLRRLESYPHFCLKLMSL